MRKTACLSIGLKLVTVVAVVLGLVLNFVNAEADGYSSASARLLYFTNLSNIWVGAVAVLFLVLEIKRLRTGIDKHGTWSYLLKLATTVSITLTCVVFCAILAPNADNANYDAWTAGSIIVHAIVPGLAIMDFVLDDGDIPFKKRHNLVSLIPPLCYFVFCIVLYLCNVDFGRGDNFPYFFLNFGSPAGIFGFSDEFPYRIGTFYWIVLISLIVYSTSLLYSFVHNLKIKRKALMKDKNAG